MTGKNAFSLYVYKARNRICNYIEIRVLIFIIIIIIIIICEIASVLITKYNDFTNNAFTSSFKIICVTETCLNGSIVS
jgi:hypothetical protein